MVNLRSKSLAIVEKDTGRRVSCDIEGYPYVLIWSQPDWARPLCLHRAVAQPAR